jgi:hypothetical protein
MMEACSFTHAAREREREREKERERERERERDREGEINSNRKNGENYNILRPVTNHRKIDINPLFQIYFEYLRQNSYYMPTLTFL